MTELFKTREKELTDAVNHLAGRGRLDLLEVCTHPDSGLANEVEKRGGTTLRIGHWNGCDMSTKGDLAKAKAIAKSLRPQHATFLRPALPFRRSRHSTQRRQSVLQTWRPIAKKGKRIIRNCTELMAYLIQNGCEVDFEHPRGAPPWQIRCLDRWRRQLHNAKPYGARSSSKSQTPTC